MKKIISVIMALTLLAGICLPALSVSAKGDLTGQKNVLMDKRTGRPSRNAPNEYTEQSGWEEPELFDVTDIFSSAHPYENDKYQIWNYENPNPSVTYMKVTFSADTMIADYDRIYIYDSHYNWVGSYTGDQMAGLTITIIDKSFTLEFYTDESVTEYGFDIVDITVFNDATFSGTCGAALYWVFDLATRQLEITGTGAMYNFDPDVPEWDWFKSSIEKIVIGNGVSTIGDNAFRSLRSLYNIDFGNTVQSIGEYAFTESWIGKVRIPDSATSIGAFAFAGCSLWRVMIPNSVVFIGEDAFMEYGGVGKAVLAGGEGWGIQIFGFAGSYAQSYAEDNYIPFYAVNNLDNFVIILYNGEDTGDQITQKIKWNQYYKKISLELWCMFEIQNDEIESIEWISDNPKVKIEDGYITNIRTGARSANISVIITDIYGNETTDTVKVIFYKYNWQLKRLQSQSVVSDNYAQRNLSAEAYNKLEQDQPNAAEPVGIMQYVLDVMNYIFSIFQKFVS